MKKQRAKTDPFNWLALAIIAALVLLSLMTQRNADWYSGDAYYRQHVVWYLIGIVVFAVAAVLELRVIERLAWFVYGISVLGLVATMFVGVEVNEAQRWLRFGGVNIQVSELAKLGVTLGLARLLHERRESRAGGGTGKQGAWRLRDLGGPALLVGVPFVLVLLQPDLGTALVLAMVAAGIVLYDGLRRTSLVVLLAFGLVATPVAWKYGGIQDYQKDRVRLWLNPDWFKLDPESGTVMEEQTLQSEQAVWAIGSGRFWGRGSRSGAQSRLKYLPEMHTDMIIATYAEERGFVGCTGLLLLFWLLLVWGLRTAHDARDRFCGLVAVGVVAMIGCQVVVNIGMVSGLFPIVGLPLPFLSYGGSAALTFMGSLGLVFNVAMRRGRL